MAASSGVRAGAAAGAADAGRRRGAGGVAAAPVRGGGGRGELGLLFEPRDSDTLAAQLERLLRDPALAERYRERIHAHHAELEWDRTAERFEELYGEIAGRRHDRDGKPQLRKRLEKRDFVHVDLHMHTDHSPDCATPVDTLLDAAKDAGSARSRSPTTTRSRARSRRASGPTGSR